MSAPVRLFDENAKNIAANKRKQRRRKVITRNTSLSCDKFLNQRNNSNTVQESIYVAGSIEKRPILNEEESFKERSKGKKVLTRSQSTFTPDILTFVSLVSSEGSDSEKDETAIPISASGNNTRRAPMLRKTGKSGK